MKQLLITEMGRGYTVAQKDGTAESTTVYLTDEREQIVDDVKEFLRMTQLKGVK